MKRIFSIILCVLMVLAIVPVSVFMVSAEGEVDTLYENDFSSAEKVAEGTEVGKTATYSDGKLSFAGWNGNSHWSKTVTLNGTTGEITVSATIYPNWNSANQSVLTVNGKTVVWNAGSYQVKLGDDTTAYNSATNKAVYVTVTIDPATGNATVVYDQAAAGYAKREATVNVGTIGETLDVKFGYAANGWSADDLKVTQVHVEEEPEQPGDEPEIPTDLFSTGAKSYTNGKNQSDTYTVKTNGTGGLITVALAYERTNWQYKSNILTINGKTVFWGNGVKDNPAYSLGDDTTTYSGWTTNCVITVVIDPLTGDATVSDNASHSATTNVGVIGETFDMVVGADYINGWNLTSLEVTQEAPECTMWIDAYQTSAVEDGKYNVRFAGVLSALPAGSDKVGFEISAPAFDKTWDLDTDTVYYSLSASFGTETVTAEERKGEYITAAAITGIPEATGAIEFVIKPYVVFTIDEVEVKVYGETKTVTVPAQ